MLAAYQNKLPCSGFIRQWSNRGDPNLQSHCRFSSS
jgi:hypothetical protein